MSENGRDITADWVSRYLHTECEWVRDRRPSAFDEDTWTLLVYGSEWTCEAIRGLDLGAFRVLRVLPLPRTT